MNTKHLEDNVKKALAVVFCANKADKVNEVDEVDGVDEVDEVDEVENKDIVDVRDYMFLDLHQHLDMQQNLELSFSSTKVAGSRIENSLKNLLDKTYQNNIVNSIINAKRQGF